MLQTQALQCSSINIARLEPLQNVLYGTVENNGKYSWHLFRVFDLQ